MIDGPGEGWPSLLSNLESLRGRLLDLESRRQAEAGEKARSEVRRVKASLSSESDDLRARLDQAQGQIKELSRSLAAARVEGLSLKSASEDKIKIDELTRALEESRSAVSSIKASSPSDSDSLRLSLKKTQARIDKLTGELEAVYAGRSRPDSP